MSRKHLARVEFHSTTVKAVFDNVHSNAVKALFLNAKVRNGCNASVVRKEPISPEAKNEIEFFAASVRAGRFALPERSATDVQRSAPDSRDMRKHVRLLPSGPPS